MHLAATWSESEAFLSTHKNSTRSAAANRVLFIAPHIKINFPTKKVVFMDLWTIQFNSLYIVPEELRLANLLQLNSIIQILSFSLTRSMHSYKFLPSSWFSSPPPPYMYRFMFYANWQIYLQWYITWNMLWFAKWYYAQEPIYILQKADKQATHTFFHTSRGNI